MISAAATKPFKATNQLERELGDITPEQLEQVTEVLRAFMKRIRGIPNQHTGEGDVLKKTCGTCAFNPMTDVLKGFAPTSYGVLRSIRETIPFLCHRGNPQWKDNIIDPANLKLCEGFKTAILSNPLEADAATKEAMEAIQRIVPTMQVCKPTYER